MTLLSNKHKYSIQRGTQLLLSPVLSLSSLLLKKNDNIVLTSSFNNTYTDNSRALFEALAKDPDFKDKVFFVHNDKQKRDLLNEEFPGKFISNLALRDIIFILRANYWVCSSLELPAPALFQKYHRKVYHLGHGMLYKRIGLREKQVSWYKKLYYKLITSNFSHTLATSEFFKDEVSLGFGVSKDRVLLSPLPKTALVSSPMEVNNSVLTDKTATHILHAPTWRPHSEVQLLPFKDLDLQSLGDFLKNNQIHLWLRLHPDFEQNIDPNILNTHNIHLFSGKDYPEVNHYLSYFDALITDYSSIYFDFLTLQRPVLFFDYDFEEYNSTVGLIDDYETIKSQPTTRSQQEFIKQLIQIKNNEFDLSKIKNIHKLVNFNIENDQIMEYVINQLFNNK